MYVHTNMSFMVFGQRSLVSIISFLPSEFWSSLPHSETSNSMLCMINMRSGRIQVDLLGIGIDPDTARPSLILVDVAWQIWSLGMPWAPCNVRKQYNYYLVVTTPIGESFDPTSSTRMPPSPSLFPAPSGCGWNHGDNKRASVTAYTYVTNKGVPYCLLPTKYIQDILLITSIAI